MTESQMSQLSQRLQPLQPSQPDEPVRVRLVAVSGGLGVPSSSRLLVDRILTHAQRGLLAYGLHAEIQVIELRDLAVPIANNLVAGYAEPRLAAALEALEQADGVIAVTPVFNASMAGLFKSFFDLVDTETLSGTPVALGATGGSARHSLVIEYALRPLFAYLKALPMPTGVFAATEEWGTEAAGERGIEGRAAQLARELADAMRTSQDLAVSPRGDGAGSGAVSSVEPGAKDSAEHRAEHSAERSAEHDEFAALMSRYAGTEVA